jgi:alkylated DNA repair protein alkB family protein 7
MFIKGSIAQTLTIQRKDGEILPHVDNIASSGRWIMGVSLGSERVLRLEHVDQKHNPLELVLPSGSLYIQRYHSNSDP